MARNDPQINLRLPQSLKAELDAAALENKRSLTAEVVGRLNRSFTSMKDVEEVVLKHAHETACLKQDIELIKKLLEEQKSQTLKTQQEQSKAIAAEVLKHLNDGSSKKI